MYHSMEIYYSRGFFPLKPLYSANIHAVAIISTVDKLYRLLKRPKREPPPSKIWPLPLVLASMEAEDRIYRDWALRKLEDYSHAGENYAQSCALVARVQETESCSGQREHLGLIMAAVGPSSVI
jgi:hypothetical protein